MMSLNKHLPYRDITCRCRHLGERWLSNTDLWAWRSPFYFPIYSNLVDGLRAVCENTPRGHPEIGLKMSAIFCAKNVWESREAQHFRQIMSVASMFAKIGRKSQRGNQKLPN